MKLKPYFLDIPKELASQMHDKNLPEFTDSTTRQSAFFYELLNSGTH